MPFWEIAVLSVKEVAERLNVSLGTVYALVSKGTIKAFRIGIGRGTLRIPEESLDAYLKGAEVEPIGWSDASSLIQEHLGL